MSSAQLRTPNSEPITRSSGPVPASLHLHIERLVIDGLPLEGTEGTLFRSALETELTRLLRDGGISTDGVRGVALDSLPHAQCALADAADARASGRRVAGTLYETLTGRARAD